MFKAKVQGYCSRSKRTQVKKTRGQGSRSRFKVKIDGGQGLSSKGWRSMFKVKVQGQKGLKSRSRFMVKVQGQKGRRSRFKIKKNGG